METAKQIFKTILTQTEEAIGSTAYVFAFSSVELISLEDGVLVFGVPAEMFKSSIEKKHKTTLEKIAYQVAKITAVQIIVSDQKNATEFFSPQKTKSRVTKEETKEIKKTVAFSFDNFVVGPSNRFAYSVARAIAHNPGQAHNPCLFYSDVGLGKTHLLHAIGNHISINNPTQNILCMSSETFLNDFVQAIEEHKPRRFKNKVRKADVLLLDDIQFFSGKPALQEEFFHTFNVLLENQKQMVFTCDRPIFKVPDLEERLQSRFRSNMVVDLQPPEPEVARGIINKILKEKKITNIDEEVIGFVVDRMRSNIRDMIGVIDRINGIQQIMKKKVDLSLVRQWYADYSPQTHMKQQNTTDEVLSIIGGFYGISVSDLKSKKRQRHITRVRQIAIFLLRESTKLSFTEIGKIFSMSHVAASRSFVKVETDKEIDTSLFEEIEDIKFKIYKKQG